VSDTHGPRLRCRVPSCGRPLETDVVRCNPHRTEVEQVRRVFDVLDRIHVPLATRLRAIALLELERLGDTSHRTMHARAAGRAAAGKLVTDDTNDTNDTVSSRDRRPDVP